MFKCVECTFSGALEEYYQHIRKWHHTQTFICGQFDCLREYVSIGTLKRHLKTHLASSGSVHLESIYNVHSDNVVITHELDEEHLIKSSLVEDITLSKLNNTNLSTPIADIEKNFRLFVISLFADPSLDHKRAASISSGFSQIMMTMINTIKSLSEEFVMTHKCIFYGSKSISKFNDREACYVNLEERKMLQRPNTGHSR